MDERQLGQVSEAARDTDTADAQIDELLQSRRLDWRFLLPDPQLGHVVYFGPPDDPLRQALSYFAESVTDGEQIDPETPDQAGRKFDTAVLRYRSPEMLVRARNLLKPGGVLYAEIQRRAGRGAPWTLKRFAAATERNGFRQIETFCNWPDFGRCTKIIPLKDASGLSNVIVNNQRGLSAWLITAVLRLGFWLGIASWFVPAPSLIARQEHS